MISDWTILKREADLRHWLFTVENKRVCSPRTGKEMDVKTIRFPPWSMILAITPDNEAVMVRQYRHGTEKVCLELPGGIVDPSDASPAVAAERELLEETGYGVSEVIPLGACFPQPAILDVKGHFYMGVGAGRVKAPELDAGEDIEVLKISMDELPAMIKSGEIDHGMVMLCFFFYWMERAAEMGSRPDGGFFSGR